MVFVVTATCNAEDCLDKGKPNVFESENVATLVVFCGKCKNQISSVEAIEKQS